jgi:hypothetical protein
LYSRKKLALYWHTWVFCVADTMPQWP